MREPQMDTPPCRGRRSSELVTAGSSDRPNNDLLPANVQEQPVDLADVRLRRDVEKVHRLGPRPIYEMLLELSPDRLLRVGIESLVARYTALDAAAVKALAP